MAGHRVNQEFRCLKGQRALWAPPVLVGFMEAVVTGHIMALRTHVKWTGGKEEKEEQEQNAWQLE